MDQKEEIVNSLRYSFNQRLEHFPISFFAMVMGLGGLSIFWNNFGNKIVNFGLISLLFASLATICMIVITFVYLFRIAKYPHLFIKDWNHVVKINFFPAFSISLLLLSLVWQKITFLSISLWFAGLVIHLILSLSIVSSWIFDARYEPVKFNPSWFIPMVGNIIVPLNGVHFGFIQISLFFFTIGMVFWAVLFILILYRLFFIEPIHQKLAPTLFILIAPPSIGLIAYIELFKFDAFALSLYYLALFIVIFFAWNIKYFIKLPIFLSAWAYSFPLIAFGLANAKIFTITKEIFFYYMGVIFLGLTTLLVCFLMWITFILISKVQICLPD